MSASSGGASFLPTPPDSDFPLANLPWGVFSERGASSSPSASRPRIGVALGDSVVDVGLLQRRGLLSGPLWSRTPDALQVRLHGLRARMRAGPLCAHLYVGSACALPNTATRPPPTHAQGPTLNALMGLGRGWWQEARATLQRLLSAEEGVLRDDARLRAEAIVPAVGGMGWAQPDVMRGGGHTRLVASLLSFMGRGPGRRPVLLLGLQRAQQGAPCPDALSEWIDALAGHRRVWPCTCPRP